MELSYDLDFLSDDNLGSPDYYEYEKFTKGNKASYSIDNDFTFKMPIKVDNGGRGFFNSLKNNEDTKKSLMY